MIAAILCLFQFTAIAQVKDDFRESFAYQASVMPLEAGNSPSQDFSFAAVYKPRCLVLIHIPNKQGAEGLLSVYSDNEGFFTIKFKIVNKPGHLTSTIPEMLANAQFHTTATSQTKFKDQKLNSVADRSYFSIITLMTAGHNYTVPFTLEDFNDLVKKCPPDGTLRHFAEHQYTPTEISVTKVGTKLSTISIKNQYEESVGKFDTPLDSRDGRWTATLTILPKTNPNFGDKKGLGIINLSLLKQETTFSETEIDKILKKIFSSIPKNTQLLQGSKETRIPMEWGDNGFQPITHPETTQTATQQKMVEKKGWPSYHLLTGTLIGCLLVFGLWMYWKSHAKPGENNPTAATKP